jgi:hypothetical protein
VPLTLILIAGLVVLFGVVVPVSLKVAGLVLGRRRQLCPGCDHKALALTGGAVAARIDESAQDSATWTEYECDRCHEQYVKPLGTGLMTRKAWLDGAKEAIPTARVVERTPR